MDPVTLEEAGQYFESTLRKLARKHGVTIKLFDWDGEDLLLEGGDQQGLFADLSIEFPEHPWGNA